MDNLPAVLWQLVGIVSLVAGVLLIIYTLIFLRRQNLPEQQLVLWDALVIFLPVIGAATALMVFNTKHRGE